VGDGPELRTPRLLLRRWREADREPFAALNADPEVMAHFPEPMTRERSDHMIELIEAEFERNDFGLWALEVVATGRFVGFAGMNEVGFTAHFTPAIEVGWRLARHAWGHGYATEAARAALSYGFEVAGLAEVVAFTSTTNLRSQAVMCRLGMTHDPADDFDHPRLPPRHRLRAHVLYRITAQRFRRLGGPG
jgi:ribosomal-protein-alanine N-acetyltransferase